MNRCLSTYVPLDDEGYSRAALKRLSNRRTFPSRLGFTRAEVIEIRAKTVTRMSISGVQDKLSLRLDRGHLEPVATDGQYILKPIPSQDLPRFRDEVPANESLTMQLAEQVFGIDTAANGCIRLADGQLAYITRRFDRERDGTRLAQEDFCQLLSHTPETAGKHYKYDSSYEELGRALEKFCPAYKIESEKLFRRIVFNYAVANGDAHLKNFSLQQTTFGDYVLTPAYDLICTKLHLPNESRLALDLFADDETPEDVLTHGFPTGRDFLELADRLGIIAKRAVSILEDLCDHHEAVDHLIERSFLSNDAKETYRVILADRQRALGIR